MLGAGDTSELLPKLYRLATGSLQPDALAAEMLERDPGAQVTFAFELASYRLFMDRLLAGDVSPHDIADTIERAQRGWLRSLVARSASSRSSCPTPVRTCRDRARLPATGARRPGLLGTHRFRGNCPGQRVESPSGSHGSPT